LVSFNFVRLVLIILRKGERTVVVPQHKPLKPGTLKGVIEQAGLTLEQFVAEL
jgi:hypothetical protein